MKMQTNKNQFAIIARIKREGSLLYNLFPISQRIKYPIFFDNLLERVYTLKNKYNIQGSFHIYKNVELARNLINSDLKNKGGIYIWWCESTGLFYVGSAKSLVGKNGRLNEYFQESRLKLSVKTKISSDIATAMLKYPKNNWNLIVLEASENLDLGTLREKEQFWMLLIPTYNRSLVVGSNEGLPLSEDRRRALSMLIYVYEISSEGRLIPNSEQEIYGIKNLGRLGIESSSQLSNSITTINLWDIQAHLKSGLPFKNQFIFTKTPLTLEEQLNWKLPIDEKGSGVWVYDFETLNFIEYFESIKLCRDKYNIPSTTFKRVRKHRLNCKGYLFSNYKL
nr:hypothetical protein [Rhizoctonia sp.]